MEVGHSLGHGAAKNLQLLPADDVSSQVLLSERSRETQPWKSERGKEIHRRREVIFEVVCQRRLDHYCNLRFFNIRSSFRKKKIVPSMDRTGKSNMELH